MTNPVKIIKKYKNRRLYDLSLSQYITMEDLQAYVIQDIEFQVVDAATGKNLTNATLLQILVELESQTTQSLPSKILRQLIVLSQHPLGQNYRQILEQTLATIQEQIQPYVSEVQQNTALWVKNSEQLMQSWQALFKKKS